MAFSLVSSSSSSVLYQDKLPGQSQTGLQSVQIHYSTDRGVSFCFPNRYIVYIEKGVAYVVRTRSSGHFVTARPRWRGLVRRPVQLGRTQQHGSPEEMTDDHQIP